MLWNKTRNSNHNEKFFWTPKYLWNLWTKLYYTKNPAVEHMNKNCPEMPKEFGEDGIIWRFEMFLGAHFH